eukprot:1946857-Amphidinium_carterae.1
MDAAELQRVFMCAWSCPRGAIITNEVIASFASPPAVAKELAAKELEYYVTWRGFKGTREVPWL